jgi:hypothetical protein
MNEFATVFIFTEKTNDGYIFARNSTLFGLFGLILGVVAIGLTISGLKKVKGSLRKVATIVFMAVWLVLWMSSSKNSLDNGINRQIALEQEYEHLLSVYNKQQYQIAEGVIEVLHTQPAGGHDKGDIIKIGGTELEINYYTSTFGYNKTLSHDGVLAAGRYARIYYADDIILRIDLKNPSP